MEFFVAGGDAAKSFESGEASFDAVALNLEVVIESRLGGAVCFWGNDGDAAKFVNLFTDSAAVVPFVHNGVTALLQEFIEQGFSLVEVGNVGPS